MKLTSEQEKMIENVSDAKTFYDALYLIANEYLEQNVVKKYGLFGTKHHSHARAQELMDEIDALRATEPSNDRLSSFWRKMKRRVSGPYYNDGSFFSYIDKTVTALFKNKPDLDVPRGFLMECSYNRELG